MKIKPVWLFCFLSAVAVTVFGADLLASAESTRVTSDGIVFPDGTTQTTAATDALEKDAPGEFVFSGTRVTTEGIVFPDGTTQTTAATGRLNYAPVEKTGQTASFYSGDDGYFEKGVGWPDPRFTDNLDGTVTDNLTDLIWLKNANCFGYGSWTKALNDCNSLADGICGLTDSSSAGDWRLPNRYELESLLDMSKRQPALAAGHPFTDVQSDSHYWSSTTRADNQSYAWVVGLFYGYVQHAAKSATGYYIWPVRGGR